MIQIDLVSYLLSTVGFLIVALLFINWVFQAELDAWNKFFIAVSIAFFYSLFFDLLWNYFGLDYHKNVVGAYAADSSTYHLQALWLSENPAAMSTYYQKSGVTLYQYFLALPYILLGPDTSVVRGLNIICFALGTTFFYYTVKLVLNKRIASIFFFILVTHIPLLNYACDPLKEVPLFFGVSLYVFAIVNLYYKTSQKHLILLFISMFFIIALRFQLLPIFIFFVFIVLTRANLQQKRKYIILLILLGSSAFFLTSGFLASYGAVEVFTERGATIQVDRREFIRVGDNPFTGFVQAVIQRPRVLISFFLDGTSWFFIHPIPLRGFEESVARNSLDYTLVSRYHVFQVFLLIFALKGFWSFIKKYKDQRTRKIILILTAMLLILSIAVIYGGIQPRRYKASFFPLYFIFSAIGISNYNFSRIIRPGLTILLLGMIILEALFWVNS